jgi:hypothetical protein
MQPLSLSTQIFLANEWLRASGPNRVSLAFLTLALTMEFADPPWYPVSLETELKAAKDNLTFAREGLKRATVDERAEALAELDAAQHRLQAAQAAVDSARLTLVDPIKDGDRVMGAIQVSGGPLWSWYTKADQAMAAVLQVLAPPSEKAVEATDDFLGQKPENG